MNTTLTPISAGTLETEFGQFHVDLFSFGTNEVVVLRTNDLIGKISALCRLQSECIGHFFADRGCDCADQVASALRLIANNPPGLIIYLRQEGMDGGLAARIGRADDDLRTYATVPLILQHYGIREITLISLNEKRLKFLVGAGIRVKSQIYTYHQGKLLMLSERLARAAHDVETGKSAPLAMVVSPKKRVLVLGDLNVDVEESKTGEKSEYPRGTGLNAAQALAHSAEFVPILFGKVGMDRHGDLIKSQIVRDNINAFIGVHPSKSTGTVRVTKDRDGKYTFAWDKVNNANDYDVVDLSKTINLTRINQEDYVFIASFLFVQKKFDVNAIRDVLCLLTKTNAKLIIDITRWSIARSVTRELEVPPVNRELLKTLLLETKLFGVIAEMQTLETIGLTRGSGQPQLDNINTLLEYFNCKWIICRHREREDTMQSIWRRVPGSDPMPIEEKEVQRYTPDDLVPGLGDRMFASALSAIHAHELKLHRFAHA